MGQNGKVVVDRERWLAVKAAWMEILRHERVFGAQRPGFSQALLARFSS